MKKIKFEDISLDDVYEFMETGDVSDAPEELVNYLNILEVMHKMFLRINHFGTKESIIKHVMVTRPELSRYKVNELYNDMLIYFYSDTEIPKNVYRNIYARKQDDLATAITLIAKTPEDFDRASRVGERAYKMRDLETIDAPELPKELFDKPIKIYAMDAAFLGEAPINRTLLAKQIDELEDFTPAEKMLMKQDAATEQIKLFGNEQEDLRKPER